MMSVWLYFRIISKDIFPSLYYWLLLSESLRVMSYTERNSIFFLIIVISLSTVIVIQRHSLLDGNISLLPSGVKHSERGLVRVGDKWGQQKKVTSLSQLRWQSHQNHVSQITYFSHFLFIIFHIISRQFSHFCTFALGPDSRLTRYHIIVTIVCPVDRDWLDAIFQITEVLTQCIN